MNKILLILSTQSSRVDRVEYLLFLGIWTPQCDKYFFEDKFIQKVEEESNQGFVGGINANTKDRTKEFLESVVNVGPGNSNFMDFGVNFDPSVVSQTPVRKQPPRAHRIFKFLNPIIFSFEIILL